jgi:hypothetical protein
MSRANSFQQMTVGGCGGLGRVTAGDAHRVDFNHGYVDYALEVLTTASDRRRSTPRSGGFGAAGSGRRRAAPNRAQPGTAVLQRPSGCLR